MAHLFVITEVLFGPLIEYHLQQHEYNLFQDYPYKLTKEEKALFDQENPHWRDFFADRQT